MSLKIVLYEPLIPQNTGNIGRLTAANYLELHLIEPLGFEISDKNLKRAGLDYWKEVNLTIHSSWKKFLESGLVNEGELKFLTTKAVKSIYETPFKKNDILVFGNESHGLPDKIHQEYPNQRIKIPMANPNIRSLNLANAVSIVSFEALRQINLS